MGAELRGVLWLLLSGERAAVESDDPVLAQKIPSPFPPSDHLVQFSLVSVDAGRRRHCRLVVHIQASSVNRALAALDARAAYQT